MMIFSYSVILCGLLVYTSEGFVSYPFNGLNLMDSYLTSLRRVDQNLGEDVMKNAISGEQCSRNCFENDRKVCHFKFRLEFYTALGGACWNCSKSDLASCSRSQCVTADGVERGILTVNRQLPGPAIQVCFRDIVVVDVENHMDGSSTSIHWHGLRQVGTPFSDGVPFVTQCPIPFGNTFRYTFEANDPGTNFYHSHSGLQKANGIYGALIVRIAEDKKLFDHDLPEFYMIVSDWMHDYGEQFFPGLPSRLSLYQSILVNGRGAYFNSTTNTFADVPLMIYNVEPHQRYRFRLINAASNICSFLIKIEGHNFTVIASDGSSLIPTVVETLHVTAGERYDFVVVTNKKPKDYAIHVKAFEPCQRFSGYAVMRYRTNIDAGSKSPTLDFINIPSIIQPDPVISKNTFNTHHPKLLGIQIAQAQNTLVDDLVSKQPDDEFYFFMGTPQVNNSILFETDNTIKYMVTSTVDNFNNVGVVNNISMELPHFALLSEPEKINDDMFCDYTNKHTKKCIVGTDICHCVHRVKVKLNSIIDFILIDIDDSQTHPFHLHGHKFYVLEMGSLESATVNQIKRTGIPMKKAANKAPVHKDTVLVPNKGYVRIRFRADNPGFWLAHCHFEWHLAIGMGFLLQVGEVNDMKKPPENFAKCHNFAPKHMK